MSRSQMSSAVARWREELASAAVRTAWQKVKSAGVACVDLALCALVAFPVSGVLIALALNREEARAAERRSRLVAGGQIVPKWGGK